MRNAITVKAGLANGILRSEELEVLKSLGFRLHKFEPGFNPEAEITLNGKRLTIGINSLRREAGLPGVQENDYDVYNQTATLYKWADLDETEKIYRVIVGAIERSTVQYLVSYPRPEESEWEGLYPRSPEWWEA